MIHISINGEECPTKQNSPLSTEKEKKNDRLKNEVKEITYLSIFIFPCIEIISSLADFFLLQSRMNHSR